MDVNIFFLDYTILLIAFLVVAYDVLKAPDDDDRNGGRRSSEMAYKDDFLREMISRIRARRHASDI